MKKMILLLTVFLVRGVVAESVPMLIERFESLAVTEPQKELKAQAEEYKAFEQNLIKEFQTGMQIVDLSPQFKLFKAAGKGDALSILRVFEQFKPTSEEAFAAISATNSKGQTPLHIAVKYRHKNALKVLLGILSIMQSEGRDISSILNAQTKQGANTALHYAIGAIKGKHGWDFMYQLLDAGADVNIKNALGETALDKAREEQRKSPSLAGFLEWYDLRKRAQSV